MTDKYFYDYINTEIEKINFSVLYKEIDEKLIYDPVYLCFIIQITIYHLEHKNKINPNVLNLFGFYTSVLKGEHETRKELSKVELLYLIVKLETILEKPSSCDNLHGLYI